jgi:hypothetical protein
VVAKSDVHALPEIDWTRVRLQAPSSGPLEWPGITSTDVGAADRAVLVARGGTAIDGASAGSTNAVDQRIAMLRAIVGPAADRLFRTLMGMAGHDGIAALLRW